MTTENWDYDKMNDLLDLTDSEDTTEINEFDEEFDTEETEQEQPKKKGFAKNPWAKLGLITLILGAGFGTVGFFLASVPTMGNNTSAERVTNDEEEDIEIINNELETLKAELALARQEQKILELGRQMDDDIPNIIIDEVEEVIPEPEIIQSPPPPTPPPIPISQPTAPPPARPTPKPPPTRSAPPPPAPEPPPVHSMEDWLALAGMGSYGGGVINNEQSNQQSQPRQVVNNQPTAQQVSQQTTRQPSLSSDEQRLMGNTRTIRAGTRVKAEIVNSMIAVQGESPLLAVITSEPIEVDGRVVIPTGTEIIFESAVHSSGMVIGNAISLFMDSREIELPPQVLQLRASQGQPLKAQRQNNPRGGILRRDAMGFALGALGKVGEISNRARTTSTFNGFGGNNTTSNFDDPNYAGAVLEGGFNPLARQWEQRNQQAISQLQGQGDIWMIPLNQPVEIIINRSFSM